MIASEPGAAGPLLIAVAGGDRAAFAALYEATAPRLFAICLRLMRRRDLAEDILQEAFVRIWQKAHLFDPERGEAMAWLATLVRRCALDRLRQRGREPLVELDPDVEIVDPNPAALAPAGAPSLDLERCLAQLDRERQQAILLAFWHGFTHDELAAHLRAPLGTVKSWIRRGLIQLKECLEG